MNEIGEVKSLRWLANMFPWTDKPEDDTDKITNCIHLYTSAGADKIEELAKENEQLKKEIERLKGKQYEN